VEITLRLRNVSNVPVSGHAPSELAGNVTASVAHESEPGLYREYQGPGWGLDCHRGGSPRELAAGAAVTLPLRFLHHAWRHPDPETSVLTPFVFSVPGTYSLKVDFVDELACQEPGVSAVASVRVLAPQGDDLAVWNALKDCFHCALLLHTGRVNTNHAAQNVALDKLRDLASRYPRSGYAPMLDKALARIDATKRGN
jgi:hypothetical protein